MPESDHHLPPSETSSPGDPVPPTPAPVVGRVLPAQGAPPPAGQVVIQGDKVEGDAAEAVQLRRQLAEEKEARKKAEIIAAEAEDKLHRVSRAVNQPRKPKTATLLFR